MITYAPLWETMKKKKATTYTLRNKGAVYSVGGGTMERLKVDLPVSTTTLDTICSILDCDITDVIEYIPNKKQEEVL